MPGDENGGETDTAEQITGTGAEENTEQTTEETETGKNTEQTTEETETGKNTELTTETETGEIMDADDTEEAEESVWMMYDGTEEPEEPDEPELDEGFHQDGSVAINEMNFPDDEFRKKIKKYDTNKDGLLAARRDLVTNKLDKLKAREIEPNLAQIRETLSLRDDELVIPFSAEKGTGKEQLIAAILDHLDD